MHVLKQKHNPLYAVFFKIINATNMDYAISVVKNVVLYLLCFSTSQ